MNIDECQTLPKSLGRWKCFPFSWWFSSSKFARSFTKNMRSQESDCNSQIYILLSENYFGFMLFPFRLDRLVKFTSKIIRCPNSGNPQELFNWCTKTNGWILYIPEKCPFLNPQVMEVWFKTQLHLEFLQRVQTPLPGQCYRDLCGETVGVARRLPCRFLQLQTGWFFLSRNCNNVCGKGKNAHQQN